MNYISYDFQDTYFSVNGLQIAVRICTDNNVYAPDPSLLRDEFTPSERILHAEGLIGAGGQIRVSGSLTLKIRSLDDGGVSISGSARQPDEHIKSMVLLVRGMAIERLISESENRPSYPMHPHTGTDVVFWPSPAATMPMIFIHGNGHEWYALSRDSQVRRKSFTAYADVLSGKDTLVLSHEEDRRQWCHTLVMPPWEIGPCLDRKSIVNRRLEDLEQVFGLKPFEEYPERAWVDDLKLIVNLHGQHWTGHVFLTFDQMADALERICEHIDGRSILAFLPAWDGRYYTCYPRWEPAEALGGRTGLSRLMAKAKELNVRVIPMLGGPNLATDAFLKSEQLTDAIMKDAYGMPIPQNWQDWDMDLSRENGGWIVNWGHPGYQSRMVDLAVDLLKEWEFAGIFLDGAIRWENSPDYSPYEGIHSWARRVREYCPDALLMAEDGYDLLWGDFGLFATSMQPLGLENAMLRYTRQSYYLAYPAPDGSGGIHEQAWNSPTKDCALPEYTIPVLALTRNAIEHHWPEIIEKIEASKGWTLKKD